jgi:hypothetical protein
MKTILLLAALAVPAFAAEPNTLTPEEKSAGFKLIFDGKTLDGFRNFKKETPDPKWQIVDGSITLTEKGGGNLITKDQFANFEFRFEFKISADGNSGIMWHSTEDGRQPYESGPEYQVLDSHSKTGYANDIAAGNLAGGFYGIIPTKPEFTRPTGEWNTGSILVSGTKITLTINGHVTADVDTSTDEWKQLLGKSKFASWPKFNKSPKGHFAFQDHGNVVSFRTLRIKELP